jgi:glycerol-3-phosphate O-acyltransferase / dihydroxyacetone phosphate acyltransferase
MEVIGRQNIPAHGPIIFTGNHMNQFVDAAVILVTNPHKVGFLVAEKSYNKPLIGHFAKAVGSIPVTRPQDQAEKGIGNVKIVGSVVAGTGTKFLSLKKGDKIRPGKNPDGFSIKSITSDTEAVISETNDSAINEEYQTYDILRAVDQSQVEFCASSR